MFRILLVLFLGLNIFSSAALAQKDTDDDRIIREKFSGEDAVVLEDELTVIVDEKFRRKLTTYRKIKILTEAGKRYAEIVHPFVPGLETVNVVFARTITPEGKKIKIDMKDAGVFLSAEDFPLHSGTQIFAVPMPALEVGSIVEYSLEIKSLEAKTEGMYSGEFGLQDFLPILRQKISVTYPESIPLTVKYVNTDKNYNFKETKKGGKVTLEWSEENVDRFTVEELMPSFRALYPAILVGTGKDWKDIGAWWTKVAAKKGKLNAKVSNQVKKMVEGITDDKEKIRVLHDFVANRIRYVGLDFGRDIFDPKDPNDVFEQKYGDCKDQANLLVLMLKEAGLEAYPALMRTSDMGRLFQGLPRIEEFNHVLAVAFTGGEMIFLDPTVENYPFGVYPYTIEGADYLLIKNDEVVFGRVPYSSLEQNRVETAIDLKIDPEEKIEGKMSVVWSGMEAGITRWVLSTMQSDMREQYVNAILGQFYSFAVLTGFEFIGVENYRDPLRLELSFAMSGWLVDTGEFVMLRMHDDSLVKIPDYLTKQRKHPVKDAYNRKTSLQLRIDLPPNLQVHSMPEDFSINENGVVAHIAFRKEQNRIIENQSMGFDAADLHLTDFPQLKNAWEAISRMHRRQVLLKRKN